ncbi:UNVERIFIED_CONTAM: hypothetical protein LK11_47220 [Mumia flava]|uniref:DUF3592 domain-containing protein n=1 Tax=Mumia flava TaxID=1348852 RepID=UPI000574BD69|nr:DUF3592 domain-containing protein [Mumia flava]
MAAFALTVLLMGTIGLILVVAGTTMLSTGLRDRDPYPRTRIPGRVVDNGSGALDASTVTVEYPLPDGTPNRVTAPVPWRGRPRGIGTPYPVWVRIHDPHDAVVVREGYGGRLQLVAGGVLLAVGVVAALVGGLLFLWLLAGTSVIS